mgnify:CR=1 FL=1
MGIYYKLLIALWLAINTTILATDEVKDKYVVNPTLQIAKTQLVVTNKDNDFLVTPLTVDLENLVLGTPMQKTISITSKSNHQTYPQFFSMPLDSYEISVCLDIRSTVEYTIASGETNIANIFVSENQINLYSKNPKYTLNLNSNGYSIGFCNTSITCTSLGGLRFLNIVKGSDIDITASHITFEESIEPYGNLKLTSKAFKFNLPYTHPMNICSGENGYTIMSSISKRPSSYISWKSKYLKQQIPLIRFSEQVFLQALEVIDIKNPVQPIVKIDCLNQIINFKKDNNQSGKIAEIFANALFEQAGYQGYPTKMSTVNGFDGLFQHPTQGIMIVESKYAGNGSLQPDTRDLEGQAWRQLSTPYNRYILKQMPLHGLQESCNLIQVNIEHIRLVFSVLNAPNKTLDYYDVGTFFNSGAD